MFNTLAILLWLALFANAGLYDSRRLLNAAEEFKLILQAVATGTVAVTFAAFALKVPTQRSWVLATWAGCTIAVLATRFAYRWLLRSMRRSGALVSRLLIVGAGRDGRDLCRAVTRARHLGFQVVGFLDDTRPVGPAAAGLPEIVGSSAEVRQAVREHEAHAVLVAGGSVATETAERVYRDLQELPVDFHLSTGVLGVAASRVAVQRFDDVPVLGLRRVELTRWQRALKRGLRPGRGRPAGRRCSPPSWSPAPWPCGCPARGRSCSASGGSARTARSSTSTSSARWWPTPRPACPPCGRSATRPTGRCSSCSATLGSPGSAASCAPGAWTSSPSSSTSSRGHMSLVGPRPLVTYEIDLTDPWARTRLRVKPGVTGLWQVSGRHRLPFDDLVRYDLFYVENWSLSMDLFVLLRTIPAVLLRSGV